MIKLYTEQEFLTSKSLDKLPCKCYGCANIFYLTKRKIKQIPCKSAKFSGKYCSLNCYQSSQGKKEIIQCTNCGNNITIQLSDKKKSTNHFCSRSCAATYNNKHKTNGNRRSKLEQYLETELTKQYRNLEILFNNKTTINSELDIYIPSLKLAFELNGIFHYEPIFGEDKLGQIQNNDQRKFQACLEQGIELCIIDVSQQKYFKEQTSIKYLNIVINVINNKLEVNCALSGTRTHTI